MQDRRRLRRPMLAAVAAGAALTVAGCGAEGAPDAKPSKPATLKPSPRASGSPKSPEDAAILAAFEDYWAARVTALQKRSDKGTNLDRYAGPEAAAQVRSDINVLKKYGNEQRGAPVHDVEVTDYTEATQDRLAAATVTDCMDISAWKTVNLETGKPLARPDHQLLEYTAEVELEKWGKQWKVLRWDGRNEKCA